MRRSVRPLPLRYALIAGIPRYLGSVARCITFRHTGRMAKAISVRLDDEAERALRLLESTGLSRSEAIRSSLLASADRMRRRSQLAAEVAALEADDDDRSEMLAVASVMESMRAAG
jgi:Arc/MetJ-type ribon-helix-helix transcriptional regulator